VFQYFKEDKLSVKLLFMHLKQCDSYSPFFLSNLALAEADFYSWLILSSFLILPG
jgi:hypothetical protein